MPRGRVPRQVAPGGRGRPDRSGGRGRQGTVAAASGLGGEQIEGRQAVRELLRARRRPIDAVYVDGDRERAAIVDEIVDLAEARGVLRLVGAHEIAAMARSDVPQGVVARAAPLQSAELAELCRPVDGRRPFLVAFDGVTDPHNLGAVLRSAVSAGATGAILPRHRSVHVTPVVAKAAAGAIEYLPMALVPGIGAALVELSAAGVWTVGLDVDGAMDVHELEVATEPLALVLGAEGRGLSPLTRGRCEVLARIDLTGPLGSLNVAAAAAVACFAVARRRAVT